MDNENARRRKEEGGNTEPTSQAYKKNCFRMK